MPTVPTSILPAGDDEMRPGAPEFKAPSVEALNEWLPDYEVTALIAYGGMGAVYHARQRRLGRDVAIKVLPPDVGRELGFAERFRREAQSMAHLHHTHIVTVYDFGETGTGLLYLVMEHVPGQTLCEKLPGGPLKTREAQEIARQLAGGLAHAHQHGVVHGDVKPANILMSPAGDAKLTDFGLAHWCHAGPPENLAPAAPMGTPDYAAPEMFKAGPLAPTADLFSLGVVFYEMLAGRLPDRANYVPPSGFGHPRWLDPIVARLMHPDPGRRFPTAQAFLEAVAGAERLNADVTRPPGPPARRRRSGSAPLKRENSLPPWVKAVAFLLLAVVVGIALRVMMSATENEPAVAQPQNLAPTPLPASTAESTLPPTSDPLASNIVFPPAVTKPLPESEPPSLPPRERASPAETAGGVPSIRPQTPPGSSTVGSETPAPLSGLIETPKPETPKFAALIPAAARNVPEFMRRLADFENELETQVAAPRNNGLAKLCENYARALLRAEQEAIKAIEPEEALALRHERERAAAKDIQNIRGIAADGRLGPLRVIFERELVKHESDISGRLTPIFARFDSSVRTLQLGLLARGDDAAVQEITKAKDEIAKTLIEWRWLSTGYNASASGSAEPVLTARHQVDVYWLADDEATCLINGKPVKTEAVDHGVAGRGADNIYRATVEVAPGDILGFSWKNFGGEAQFLVVGKRGSRVVFNGSTMGWQAIDGVPPPPWWTDPKVPGKRPDLLTDTRQSRRHSERFSRVAQCRDSDYVPLLPSKTNTGGVRRIITNADVR
ncbi:MAG: serine/threonine-protein kinase [Verrucomicrobiales bacterium]